MLGVVRMLRDGALSSLVVVPQFRRLWLSNFFYFAGIWSQTLVLGWYVFDITRSEFLLAVFTTARLAPMLLGPFGGLIADRVSRVRFLMVITTWALIVIMALAVLVTLHKATYWEIVLGGFLIGLTQSPAQPARFTLVLDLVGRGRLTNANALNSLAINTTQALGPSLGGVLVGTLGVAPALWVSGSWYLISVVCLLRIRDAADLETHHDLGRVRIGKELMEGIRSVMMSNVSMAILAVSFVANIFIWPIYQTFMPVFADRLGLGSAGLGWLFATFGCGAISGSLIIASKSNLRYKGRVYVLGTGVFGVGLAAFALSTTVPLSFVLVLVVGLGSACFSVLQSTLLLLSTPDGVRGRVMGLQVLAIGILPIATMVHGAAAGAVGVWASSAVSGVLAGLLMLGIYVRARGLRALGSGGDGT